MGGLGRSRQEEENEVNTVPMCKVLERNVFLKCHLKTLNMGHLYNTFKNMPREAQYSSIVENLPIMCNTLGSIASIAKITK